MTAKKSAQKPHIHSNIIVVVRILPMPTNGETMPPNRKPDAPKIAEAVPTISRPSSIAIVVADVRMKPILTSMMKVSTS